MSFSIRVAKYSEPHSLIPMRYIEPWRRDMVNRELIVNVSWTREKNHVHLFVILSFLRSFENADQSNIPHYEHDDALYFNKREQMHYNVEPRDRVDKKYQLPSRSDQLQPRFYEIYDRHRSSLLSRYDPAQRFRQVPHWLSSSLSMKTLLIVHLETCLRSFFFLCIYSSQIEVTRTHMKKNRTRNGWEYVVLMKEKK